MKEMNEGHLKTVIRNCKIIKNKILCVKMSVNPCHSIIKGIILSILELC